MGDQLGADQSACPGAVLEDERLAHAVIELLAEQPPLDVGAAARAERHDDTHRLGRPRLGEHRARERHARGGSGKTKPYSCVHISLLVWLWAALQTASVVNPGRPARAA